MSAAGAAADDVDSQTLDLARFFNHLVDLIPAKYYHDEGQERIELQHMKKVRKPCSAVAACTALFLGVSREPA